MSRYEWEKGSVVLPSATFAKFRRAVVNDLNAHQDHLFERAKAVHQHLTTWPAPKRRALTELALNQLVVHFGVTEENDMDAVTRALSKRHEQTRALQLRTPLRKHFPHHKTTVLAFRAGDGVSLTFDPAQRTAQWSVPENNNAVEIAWETALGKAFSKALRGTTWTRGTGGRFLSANEYDRDEDKEAPGRGSRISQHFGPLGEAAYEAAHGFNPRTQRLARRVRR